MQYFSTRGAPLGTFCDVLLTGLAPDGGLAMPERFPRVDAATLQSWQALDYAELAFAVMQPFVSDIPADDLRALLRRTYTENAFHSKDITPLTRLGASDTCLLELSNGPSLAFKDMAMQFLGQVFEYVLEKRGETINILGATSGDTGSAAEYAMLGKHNVNVFMLSPFGRMSAFQQAQMYSLDAPNIFNIAVRGVFDDCQDLVKAVNADAAFKTRYRIGAVNSINWARILAQVVYYFKAYLALGLAEGAEMDVCVPSGNFGNIFSGFVAKQMGLPIGQLIVATNENDVLHEFFTTGSYRVRKAEDVGATSSPSMDIGKASNFERYIHCIGGSDAAKTAALWRELEEKGVFALSGDAWQAVQASGFAAGKSTHADRLATIRATHAEYGRLIDPHTADGVFVAAKHQRAGVPMVCLETALPAKFAATMQEALGSEPPRPARFDGIEDKPRHVQVMDNDIDALKAFIAAKLGG
ncbi:MAG: threonine synthase [Cardiobacteriaceae bacterium]|nr:threonine synthase [Cardiobacteriaceae bacterium]